MAHGMSIKPCLYSHGVTRCGNCSPCIRTFLVLIFSTLPLHCYSYILSIYLFSHLYCLYSQAVYSFVCMSAHTFEKKYIYNPGFKPRETCVVPQ